MRLNNNVMCVHAVVYVSHVYHVTMLLRTCIIAVMWTKILCVYDVSVLWSCDSHMQVGDYVYMFAMVMWLSHAGW